MEGISHGVRCNALDLFHHMKDLHAAFKGGVGREGGRVVRFAVVRGLITRVSPNSMQEGRLAQTTLLLRSFA